MNMRRAVCMLMLGLTVLPAAGLDEAPPAQPLFVERDGYVIIEAEGVPVAAPWVLEARDDKRFADHTGAGYLRMTGNSDAGGQPNGILRYRVLIENPGSYRLRIRGLNDAQDGAGDHGNDCYVRVPGQKGALARFHKTMAGGKTWKWEGTIHVKEKTLKPIYELSAGEHVIEIAGRSRNYCFDRIALYRKDAESAATDLNTAPSPTTRPATQE